MASGRPSDQFRLLYPESRAALAAAVRLGRVSLRPAVAQLERLVEAIELITPSPDLLRPAGDLAEDRRLRGYDAVHLASAEAAADSGLVFACADRRLREAALRLGLGVGP